MFQSPNVTEHDDRAERGGWAASQALSRVPEEGGQEEGEAFPHQPRGGGKQCSGDSININDNV